MISYQYLNFYVHTYITERKYGTTWEIHSSHISSTNAHVYSRTLGFQAICTGTRLRCLLRLIVIEGFVEYLMFNRPECVQ